MAFDLFLQEWALAKVWRQEEGEKPASFFVNLFQYVTAFPVDTSSP